MTLRQTSRRSAEGSLKSSRVTTALTPGRASAALASMERMRAWAWGLRSTRPISMPGMVASAPKRARPVTLSRPSGRNGRVPTTLNLRFIVAVLSSGMISFLSLQRRMLDELALQGMQLVALGHALDGLDVDALGFSAQDQAGTDQTPVQHDAAGPAIARAAAFLAAGQAEAIAQHVEKRLFRLADVFDGIAVNLGGNVNLVHYLPLARCNAISAARRARTPAT